jgi:hypothetical protein
MFSLECLEYVSAKDTEPTWNFKEFNDPTPLNSFWVPQDHTFRQKLGFLNLKNTYLK